VASYTLTTTPDQEALLTWIVGQYNTEHDTQLTNTDYVALRFPQLLGPFRQQFQAHLAADITAKFAVADAATQQQVLTLLNVK